MAVKAVAENIWLAKVVRFADINDQVEACRQISSSDKNGRLFAPVILKKGKSGFASLR